MGGRIPVLAVVGIVIAMAVIVAGVLYLRDRRAAIEHLLEIDESLRTYRNIRSYLGTTLLTTYPSLIRSEVRLRLLHQLRAYDDIDDDAAEMRWERVFMPRMSEVTEQLRETEMARQDSEFADTIDGFETNERLIDDMRTRRSVVAKKLGVGARGSVREVVRDSHAIDRIALSQAKLKEEG